MKRAALFGANGFVGSNLRRKTSFSDLYDSKNFESSKGQSFDLVVMAAARAVKWKINQNVEEDFGHISALKEIMNNISCKTFVLISTVDVFQNPVEVDEDSIPEHNNPQAYGRHRLELENHAREKFENHFVVRLPGLFGPGLKKNAIYDLANNNRIEDLNPLSSLQYYDLSRLWDDINVSIDNSLRTIHMATEPITTGELAMSVFDINLQASNQVAPANYDLWSKYAYLFGGKSHYFQTKDQVVNDIKEFLVGTK